MRISDWSSDVCSSDLGFTGRDSTPEALLPLLDKEMPGFGELFRAISFEEIGTSSLQSRAFAGLANGTFVFCLPGSTSACRTAWEKIIRAQLDARTRPCNLATLRPRLRSEEHTSELQSLMRISYAVFCLKKKKKRPPYNTKEQ